MSKNLNELLDQEKTVNLGKKEITIPKVPVSRALEITAKQDHITNILDEELKKRIKKDKDFAKLTKTEQIQKALNDYRFAKVYIGENVNLVLFIIRQKSLIARLFNWIKGNSISKKWIMNNLDVDELREFTDKVINTTFNLKKK